MRPADHIAAALSRGLPDMALRNCHATGVDSIVLSVLRLGERKLRMDRVFVAHSDLHPLDTLYDQDGHFNVAVHNHRYDLELWPLVGQLVNHELEIGSDIEDLRRPVLHEFDFQTGVRGQCEIKYRRPVTVLAEWDVSLQPGAVRRMAAAELHTVIVPKAGPLSAWLVVEFEDFLPSLFYSPLLDPKVTTEGMYEPIPLDEATRLLERVIEAAP